MLTPPELSWQDGLPIANQFNDPYFSRDNGLAESQHVFLQHNGLPARWQSWPWDQAPSFCVIETGFGTGLNFLLTLKLWQEYLATQTHKQGWLHFTSIEKYPLTKAQLSQALALWPELAPWVEILLTQYPLPVEGAHLLYWPELKASLTLHFCDIDHALNELSGPVHAWYLDGFAPARNPQMWSEQLFITLGHLSQAHEAPIGTTLATFTAAGAVRRGLQGAGFKMTKVPGFGHKREMLTGVYQRTQGPVQPAYFHTKPWLVAPERVAIQNTVAVVGAGLAGCYSARALAERGFTVQVFDPAGIAQQASGNAQGGIYLKLSAADSTVHTEFYLSAFQFAVQSFERYLGAGTLDNPAWQQCGLLQLAFSPTEAQRQEKFNQTHQLPRDIIYSVDQAQASALAGCELNSGGLFFPKAGWVSPIALCTALLQHPNIELITDRIDSLHHHSNGWHLAGDQGSYQAQQVVLANAMACQELITDSHLSLKSIRGQLSYLHTHKTPPLKTVLSGRTYMAPPLNGRQCLGATFNLHENTPELRPEDHLENLSHLPDFGPAWQTLAQEGEALIQGGKVGFRCTTSDFLPVVGAVPKTQDFLRDFHSLAQDKNRIPARPYAVYPGLWLNVGHGSRGLVSIPLSAEILAQQINQSANVVGQSIIEALWPGRFLARDLIRGQVKTPA